MMNMNTSPLSHLKPGNSNASRARRPARVLAFARGWSPEREESILLQAVRQRVAALGIDLIVVGDGDVCMFDGDGQFERVDRLAADLATTTGALASAQRGDAAFLLAPARVNRLAYDGTLLDALDAAETLLSAREAA
jgi:hypothetical protein